MLLWQIRSAKAEDGSSLLGSYTGDMHVVVRLHTATFWFL